MSQVQWNVKQFAVSLTIFIHLFGGRVDGRVPEWFCRKTYNPPIIDGVLDDRCWREAHGVTGFSLLGGEGPATQQTYAFALHDHSYLYVAFVCLESQMDSVVAKVSKRDGAVWTDDCVEVFMDTNHDHSTYCHIIASVAEIRYDEMGRLQPWTWDCDWSVSTVRYSDRWTAEIAIPFWCMHMETPKPGDIWGFNVNREECRLGELSGWAPTWSLFHEPQYFGHLIFEPEI